MSVDWEHTTVVQEAHVLVSILLAASNASAGKAIDGMDENVRVSVIQSCLLGRVHC